MLSKHSKLLIAYLASHVKTSKHIHNSHAGEFVKYEEQNWKGPGETRYLFMGAISGCICLPSLHLLAQLNLTQLVPRRLITCLPFSQMPFM